MSISLDDAIHPQPTLEPLAHARAEFSFIADGPVHDVAPLFGPEGERAWAGTSWNPRFIHPRPPADVRGAVFLIDHPLGKATWINTAYDPAGGRMQYVYVIDALLATLIDVHVQPAGTDQTRVDVAYERTALSAGANAEIERLNRDDAAAGPEWSAAINKFLANDRHA